MKNHKSVMAALQRQIPIWGNWFRQLDVPETSRQGVTKGDPIPVGGDKFRAAAMMILYPRGLQSAKAISVGLGTSGGVVRNWRNEERFQALASQLETNFIVYVLERLHDEYFFQTLFTSYDEPLVWNDRILEKVYCRIGQALLETMSNEELEAFKGIQEKCDEIKSRYQFKLNQYQIKSMGIPNPGWRRPSRTFLFGLHTIFERALTHGRKAYGSGKTGRPKKISRHDVESFQRERCVKLVEMYLRDVVRQIPEDSEFYDKIDSAQGLIFKISESYRVNEK